MTVRQKIVCNKNNKSVIKNGRNWIVYIYTPMCEYLNIYVGEHTY